MFGITQHEHRVIQSLPEGVRKLVDTALALALSPQILLMDEPTSGVSSQEKFDIMDTLVPILRAQKVIALALSYAERLRQLRKQKPELAILIAESNPSLLESMADHLITIERGEAQIQS